MRIKFIGTAAIVFCLTGAAFAQIATLPPGQVTQQMPTPAGVLRNAPGVRFTPPVLTGALLTAEQARKLNIIRAFGMTVPASALQPSIWLTPQRPYVDANTNISAVFAGSRMTTINYATPLYGSITIPGTTSSSVSLAVGGTAPNTYHLVECYVSSTVTQPYAISTSTLTARAGDSVGRSDAYIRRTGNLADGRISILFEPSMVPNRTFVVSSQRPTAEWVFGGCEITPVRI